MRSFDVRKTLVPWLWDSDLDEGREACWTVDVRSDEERLSCWAVTRFDAPDTFLVVRAIRGNGNDGGRIALAISESPRYDVYAKDVFVLNRRASPQADGDSGTDAA
jgi:hypothetical protein